MHHAVHAREPALADLFLLDEVLLVDLFVFLFVKQTTTYEIRNVNLTIKEKSKKTGKRGKEERKDIHCIIFLRFENVVIRIDIHACR